MTPKQILDSFSETLLRDERILSAQERALLSSLLQHANSATSAREETGSAVRAVIASAVGEIVGQRAFTVLGGSILERILEESSSSTSTEALPATEFMGPKDPQPPSGPKPPAVRAPQKDPQPPHHHPKPVTPSTPKDPQPPAPMGAPKDPQPPSGHGVSTRVVAQSEIAVAEKPEKLPARTLVLDEFLAPQELEELMRFTLEHEADFQASEVIAPCAAEGGVVNYDHRRSRVLMEVGKYQDVILDRVKSVLPQVLQSLGMEEFAISGVEAQITASNDGDFFHFHSDNASENVASRSLTFVYFFHREPRAFEGGELRIHDAHLENGAYASAGSYQTVAPQQNQIVFFPCQLLHEITPVKCSSQLFADSRFTLNGWLRR